MRHPFVKMRCPARSKRMQTATFYLRERWQRKYDSANILKKVIIFLKKGCLIRMLAYFCTSAATPGNVLPSIHSKKAPPAVEI